MSYVDETSLQRMRARVYERKTKLDEWTRVAEYTIELNSGEPDNYEYLLYDSIHRAAQDDETFILPATRIAKRHSLKDVRVRKHIDQMCQWGLLEVVGKEGVCLVYSLSTPR